MKKTLISLSLTALLASLSFHASAVSMESSVARAERPEKVEKPEKPEKKEKIGAIENTILLAREAGERPRGADNERPGDRQRRGGRNA